MFHSIYCGRLYYMIQEGIRTNKNYETFLLQMFCFSGARLTGLKTKEGETGLSSEVQKTPPLFFLIFHNYHDGE